MFQKRFSVFSVAIPARASAIPALRKNVRWQAAGRLRVLPQPSSFFRSSCDSNADAAGAPTSNGWQRGRFETRNGKIHPSREVRLLPLAGHVFDPH
jgi:hypothetical protein